MSYHSGAGRYPCPTCRTSGRDIILRRDCPRCDGRGWLDYDPYNPPHEDPYNDKPTDKEIEEWAIMDEEILDMTWEDADEASLSKIFTQMDCSIEYAEAEFVNSNEDKVYHKGQYLRMLVCAGEDYTENLESQGWTKIRTYEHVSESKAVFSCDRLVYLYVAPLTTSNRSEYGSKWDYRRLIYKHAV